MSLTHLDSMGATTGSNEDSALPNHVGDLEIPLASILTAALWLPPPRTRKRSSGPPEVIVPPHRLH
jgi:hypothetical protein